MKISTPKLTIPSITFRLEVVIGILLLYLFISCIVFGSCLRISFRDVVKESFIEGLVDRQINKVLGKGKAKDFHNDVSPPPDFPSGYVPGGYIDLFPSNDDDDNLLRQIEERNRKESIKFKKLLKLSETQQQFEEDS